MKKGINIIEVAMRHRQIVILIVTLLVLFGVYSLIQMPKNEFPNFTVRQGLVVAAYPGATTEEVEEQVTKPLENFIFTYKEVKKKKTYSQSRDGLVFINVELNDNVKNKDEFWSKFKHGLANFKSKLPTGVLALQAQDDFGDTSAMLITFESKDKTYRELEKYQEKLEDKLRSIDVVSNLRNYGLQKEQISIYVDQKKLAAYGIGNSTLSMNLFSQGFTTMSGSVKNDRFVTPIHVDDSYNKVQDVANQIVYSDSKGNVIRLKDVARVVKEYPEPDQFIRNNGTKCILLSIEMREGNNIVEMGKQVKKVLKEFQKELPAGVKIYTITDQSQVVNDSVINFLKELLIAIIAVIIVVMLLMPMRVASIAASTIPITIFISLGLFYALGIELNTVTLAVLIVTLGMIVDNSIVIIDCYIEKIGNGENRWHAAVESAKEFFTSIFSATLAISITFFPFLLTMKGMFGDFLQSFPWAMSFVLFISLLIAIFLVPYMNYHFIKQGLKPEGKKNKRTFLDWLQENYEKILNICFRWPRTTLALGIIVVALGGILFSHLPQKLMPIAQRNQFAVEFSLPKGSAVKETAAIEDSLEHILKRDERVVSITSFAGMGSPRFQTSYAPQLPGTNIGQFIVNTKGEKETVELLNEYAPKYTNYFPEARLRFKQLEYSDASSPIEIRVSGDSISDLREMGDSIMARLRKMPETVLVRTNYEEQEPAVSVKMNDDEATRLGVNRASIQINTAMRFGDGIPLTTMWEGDYPIGVVLKTDKDGQQTQYTDVANEYVPAWGGIISIPLRQVSKVRPEWEEGNIVRRNGVRTLSVLSDVKRGINLTTTTAKIKENLKTLKLPKGVELSYGGQDESDSETIPQIVGGLLISVVIIFFILLFHFRKINMALLILASMMLCIPGAALGIWLFGLDISITCVLGIVSLMGIIVRNGIIMLDYAEELRNKGHLTVRQAALQSSRRRMRPIFLTSAAASMGVIPMIISKSPLWAPMGAVVCVGTLFSMVLIVTILPIAYWGIFRHTSQHRAEIAAIEQ